MAARIRRSRIGTVSGLLFLASLAAHTLFERSESESFDPTSLPFSLPEFPLHGACLQGVDRFRAAGWRSERRSARAVFSNPPLLSLYLGCRAGRRRTLLIQTFFFFPSPFPSTTLYIGVQPRCLRLGPVSYQALSEFFAFQKGYELVIWICQSFSSFCAAPLPFSGFKRSIALNAIDI